MHTQAKNLASVAISDADLVAACRAGDRDALRSLLRRHQAAIERACRRLCGPDAYDDVLQDTYLAIVRSIASFRGEASFTTWAFAIARSCVTRWVEAGRRSGSELSSALDEPGEGSTAARVEAGELVELALAELGPLDRKILLLRDGEGMSPAEIADCTGATVAAVKTRLHRARVAARARIHALDRLPLAA